MDISLTLDQILELPIEVLRVSEIHNSYNELLDDSICKQFDTRELKGKITVMFKRFKMLKYQCNIPIESNIKLSVNYDLREGSKPKRANSQVENVVLNSVDNMLWGTTFYNDIIEVSKILTNEESVYLVETFFSNKPEDIVADKLIISRRSLYNVKKSCLVKLWFKLETLYSMNAR